MSPEAKAYKKQIEELVEQTAAALAASQLSAATCGGAHPLHTFNYLQYRALRKKAVDLILGTPEHILIEIEEARNRES